MNVEDLSHLIVEQAPDALVMLDPNGVVVDIGRAHEVLHGIVKDLTPAEIQALALYVQSK